MNCGVIVLGVSVVRGVVVRVVRAMGVVSAISAGGAVVVCVGGIVVMRGVLKSVGVVNVLVSLRL